MCRFCSAFSVPLPHRRTDPSTTGAIGCLESLVTFWLVSQWLHAVTESHVKVWPVVHWLDKVTCSILFDKSLVPQSHMSNSGWQLIGSTKSHAVFCLVHHRFHMQSYVSNSCLLITDFKFLCRTLPSLAVHCGVNYHFILLDESVGNLLYCIFKRAQSLIFVVVVVVVFKQLFLS